jgi:uncharacterized protein YaiE (UPF0345 family)
MSLKNVEIKKPANVYHEGRVTSRSIITADGEMKTLGIMLPGTYRFHTECGETIDITQGQCRVKIGDKQDWQSYAAGESFSIPAHSAFDIEVTEVFDYVCHYDTA